VGGLKGSYLEIAPTVNTLNRCISDEHGVLLGASVLEISNPSTLEAIACRPSGKHHISRPDKLTQALYDRVKPKA
jgi:hypothetical protein